MKRKILALIVLLSAVTAGHSQNSQVLYFMNLPQATTLNPAFKPTGRFYLGLPGISDISVRLDNNFLSLSDLFTSGVISDSTLSFLERGPWLNDFLAGLGDNNSLEPQAGVRLFGLAFTVKDNLRFSLDITERAEANLVFPGDLFRLGLGGNSDFIGKTLDLSSFRTDMMVYHEIGLGASGNITEKLRIGGRLKILSGVASAYLTNNHSKLTVNEDFTHTADADISLNMSAPVLFTTESDGTIHGAEFDEARFDDTRNAISYLKELANPGAGIDLGAEYRFSEKLAVSAAVNDLGFIRWKRDLSQLTINSTFKFNGLTMQDVYDESLDFEELINWTIDSLQNVLELADSPQEYTTYLPAKVVAAFSYTPVRYFTLGLLSQTRFEGPQAHQSVTLSGNLHFRNIFSTTLAYTAANRRFDNLGFGMALRGGPFQFFVLVDNIPLKYSSFTSGEQTIRLPENMNTVNARLGLNLLFGNRERDKTLPPM
ncbi:MAG: hypothetical protein KBB24_04080 [Bacteroidales bacterium]|jgi:hypothetical protein|nr:hypothetical protein [Bacteroidales bacterium]MDX9926806.1 DUF5723 family protein [Bacteroidales bacterium]HNX83977.1 DUF5723 family protein [Bacteroidales bacterium]HOC47939.1 DUF5723 family protein [Bacteroidales bacterium]HPS96855.1 DUF5723 family protein [Bacteroidales bacterium]